MAETRPTKTPARGSISQRESSPRTPDGTTQLRALVTGHEIDGIVCTWYDRLTRSRDFYELDREFKEAGVQFVTLHDPTDTNTAAGRFMESMLVAAKTYDPEQTSEKVRGKMRMRAEKGMWNGGPIPFAFLAVDKSRTIKPDPEVVGILRHMFEVYVETGSDYKSWSARRPCC